MTRLQMKQDRYMQDNLQVRLGGLAANLARIHSFSDHDDHEHIVESLLEESKYFIEWTGPAADLEKQICLVELQLQLAIWQRKWSRIWADHRQRKQIAASAQEWSRRILKISGLLSSSNT